VSQAKLLGKVVEVVVIIFAAVITLEQLGIAAKIIELTISIVLASLGLGVALAFGLGCRDLAAKYISDLIESLKSKK
jgi:small-conductance mechanosensitive channel